MDTRDFLKLLFADLNLDYSNGTDKALGQIINLIKNNVGLFYWPDFGFNGLVNLIPGQGYQIRIKDDAQSNGFIPNKIYTANIASHEDITNVVDYTEKLNNVTIYNAPSHLTRLGIIELKILSYQYMNLCIKVFSLMDLQIIYLIVMDFLMTAHIPTILVLH